MKVVVTGTNRDCSRCQVRQVIDLVGKTARLHMRESRPYFLPEQGEKKVAPPGGTRGSSLLVTGKKFGLVRL